LDGDLDDVPEVVGLVGVRQRERVAAQWRQPVEQSPRAACVP
jgi:hypothetical protein